MTQPALPAGYAIEESPSGFIVTYNGSYISTYSTITDAHAYLGVAPGPAPEPFTTIPGAPCDIHPNWLSDYCPGCQMSVIVLVAKTSDPLWTIHHALDNVRRYVLAAALRKVSRNLIARDAYRGSAIETLINAIYADQDKSAEVLPTDIFCETCSEYVSQVLPSDTRHWDKVCGGCQFHTDSDDCTICPECDAHECECCAACEKAPGSCECCDGCGNPEDACECEHCEDCGGNPEYCGCGSQPFRFGTTKEVTWTSDTYPGAPVEVGSMSDLDLTIDPVRAAADYYLLDGIVNLVRFEQAILPEGSRMPEKRDVVHNDDMLSAWTASAARARNALIARLDQNFLAYAVSAVGGELRYHKACAQGWAPQSRSAAWAAFSGIVQEKGASVLYEAVDLFEEFRSSSYGGTKWAQIAKVTAMRLSGKMAPWLFVDRIFTLEHNGGCVLNKQHWGISNGLGYGLTHMQKVLNAHAAAETDWDLLLRVASPEVSFLFRKADARIAQLARRSGGRLPGIVANTKAKVQHPDRPCDDCGYYGCICP